MNLKRVLKRYTEMNSFFFELNLSDIQFYRKLRIIFRLSKNTIYSDKFHSVFYNRSLRISRLYLKVIDFLRTRSFSLIDNVCNYLLIILLCIYICIYLIRKKEII